MIYIIRKSKRSAKRNQIKLDVNEAKEFLYNIEARSFRTSEFIVYCGDSPEELDEIINYFNEDYLQEMTDDVVIVYKVNGDITKYDRLRNKGATIKSIDNFREKIEKEILGSSVSIVYNADDFEIFIEHPIGIVKIICDYRLVIKKALASYNAGEFVDISVNDEIVKVVNRLFRKQRYYYKQKNG
jgi:hypothetical protein